MRNQDFVIDFVHKFDVPIASLENLLKVAVLNKQLNMTDMKKGLTLGYWVPFFQYANLSTIVVARYYRIQNHQIFVAFSYVFG